MVKVLATLAIISTAAAISAKSVTANMLEAESSQMDLASLDSSADSVQITNPYTAQKPIGGTNVELNDADDTGKDIAVLTPTASPLRAGIVDTAESLIGTKFTANGNAPTRGFDSPGFVKFVLEQNKVRVPARTVLDMSKSAQKLTLDEVQPGDLVFFNGSKGFISHVGLVQSSNPLTVVHATPSEGVKSVNLAQSAYWKTKAVAYGSFVRGEDRF